MADEFGTALMVKYTGLRKTGVKKLGSLWWLWLELVKAGQPGINASCLQRLISKHLIISKNMRQETGYMSPRELQF
jgi:hypothetical protein